MSVHGTGGTAVGERVRAEVIHRAWQIFRGVAALFAVYLLLKVGLNLYLMLGIIAAIFWHFREPRNDVGLLVIWEVAVALCLGTAIIAGFLFGALFGVAVLGLVETTVFILGFLNHQRRERRINGSIVALAAVLFVVHQVILVVLSISFGWYGLQVIFQVGSLGLIAALVITLVAVALAITTLEAAHVAFTKWHREEAAYIVGVLVFLIVDAAVRIHGFYASGVTSSCGIHAGAACDHSFQPDISPRGLSFWHVLALGAVAWAFYRVVQQSIRQRELTRADNVAKQIRHTDLARNERDEEIEKSAGKYNDLGGKPRNGETMFQPAPSTARTSPDELVVADWWLVELDYKDRQGHADRAKFIKSHGGKPITPDEIRARAEELMSRFTGSERVTPEKEINDILDTAVQRLREDDPAEPDDTKRKFVFTADGKRWHPAFCQTVGKTPAELLEMEGVDQAAVYRRLGEVLRSVLQQGVKAGLRPVKIVTLPADASDDPELEFDTGVLSSMPQITKDLLEKAEMQPLEVLKNQSPTQGERDELLTRLETLPRYGLTLNGEQYDPATMADSGFSWTVDVNGDLIPHDDATRRMSAKDVRTHFQRAMIKKLGTRIENGELTNPPLYTVSGKNRNRYEWNHYAFVTHDVDQALIVDVLDIRPDQLPKYPAPATTASRTP